MKAVNKVEFIKTACKDKDVLDLGCIRHSAEFALNDPNWLHTHLQKVSKSIVGIDYLDAEVKKLRAEGYFIFTADVTQPLPFAQSFDVIVAGDLIEHLTNFDGFFQNVNRLLKDDGVLIITTPNPFYSEEFFYTVFKNKIFVNPEHTCWVDLQCMNQLISRFSLRIDELYYLNNTAWALKYYIANKDNNYDILLGKWNKNTIADRVYRKIYEIGFGITYLPLKLLVQTLSPKVKYADYLAVIKKRQ